MRGWTTCSGTCNISSLKNVQPSWTPFPFRTDFQGTPSTSVLNSPNYALQESGVAVMLTTFLTFLTRTKPCVISWSLFPRLPHSDHHTTCQPFSVHKEQIQWDTSPCCLPHQLCHKVIFHTPGTSWNVFCLLCCISSRCLMSWSPPQEQGPGIVRFLPTAYRTFHLPLHPCQVVCMRFPPGYLSCWHSPLNFCLMGTQLSHHHL